MSDSVLGVCVEKERDKQPEGDLWLYKAAETKDDPRPGVRLLVRLENKSRATASFVLTANIGEQTPEKRPDKHMIELQACKYILIRLTTFRLQLQRSRKELGNPH